MSFKSPLASLSVLLVEDDDDSRLMLADTLHYYGASVLTARSADEALRMLHAHSADVVLADIRLPDKDGFFLIHEIRTDENPNIATVPAISMTARRRTEDSHEALESGFHVHMQKPIDVDALVETVVRLACSERGERASGARGPADDAT